MTILHETEVPEVEHPGRFMRWLANEDSLHANNLSVCVIRVMPGETVRPAHSHPKGEEAIHIISGSGRVMVNGEVSPVKTGSTILIPQGEVHMLQNTGNEEMKVPSGVKLVPRS